MQTRGGLNLWIVVILLVTVAVVRADTKTWTGDGDWFTNTLNWAPSPPVDLDDVIISSGNLLLTNSTPDLTSFTLSGGTVTCSNWTTAVRATTVDLNGGLLTCSDPFADAPAMSNRVYIVCTDLTLAAGERISVYGRGFASTNGPGAAGNNQGATHGGKGRNNGDAIYGSIKYPETPGSGGPPVDLNDSDGGGAVKIKAAGIVTINGTINAAGEAGGGSHNDGGGAGGSILIDCDTFAGSGALNAKGGGAGHGRPGGGGGRIAVHYNSASSPTVSYDLRGGYATAGAQSPVMAMLDGELGTLYLSDNSFFLQETMSDGGGRFTIPGVTSWSPANLTISGYAIGFPTNFDLQVAGDLVLSGSYTGMELRDGATLSAGSATLTGGGQIVMRDSNSFSVAGDVAINIGHIWTRRPQSFTCSGDLSLTNASRLWVYSAATNGTSPDYGSLVDIGGTLSVAANAIVYPYCDSINGGGPLFRVKHVDLRTGGLIDATGRGYAIEEGPAAGGYTVGGTHGGQGSGNSAPTYGVAEAPITAGSGGGTGISATAGGGVVRIETVPPGRMAVNGTIQANGADGSGHYSGRGAGGSIYLRCQMFEGSGSLYAKGGGAGSSTGSSIGGGGGGRLALWAISYDWTGSALTTNLVAGGIGTGGNGTPGTIVVEVIPPKGTLIIIR